MNETGTHKPLGLIAGLGELPVTLAERVTAAGRPVFVVRLLGFEEPRLAGFPGATAGLGQLGRQIQLLREAGCEEIVFAGVVRRPDFSQLKLDFRGARLMPAVLREARKGDDALLRVLVEAFENEGFRVRGAEEMAGGLTEAAGTLTRHVPDPAARADIVVGARVAAEIGRLDIGQGCVVCDGLVLAVEAQEGTDAMLQRVAILPEHIRGTAQARRGVLIKRPKPIQERRIDLPTIGVRTVDLAAAAGLAGIAVEAGGALIMQRASLVAKADAAGLFVEVFDPDALS